MNRKSYVTRMPDKTGAFLLASKIIAKYCGNIVRVSYNKAVDLHMLFLDVEATAESHQKIAKELETVGYLKNELSETRVIEVNIKIPDQPGAVLPVLKILDLYNINCELWDIEDKIRDLERRKDFGNEFISTARSVYFSNDRRSEIKREINIKTSSGLIEEKSYEKY